VSKQLIVIVSGLALLAALFFFGSIVGPKKPAAAQTAQQTAKTLNIDDLIAQQKQKLTLNQLNYLTSLEQQVKRGDVKNQQLTTLKALANFWKDSAKQFEPYAFYNSEAAKLDNSEKSLTFAAQLILDNLRMEQDETKLNWQASQAIELFEKALQLNPTNNNLKVGLGSCYIFGKGRGSADAGATMQGIQKLLEVVNQDSTNMRAQLVLGIGGFTSGQYDNAIKRLSKVVKAEPKNLEAVAFLADCYAAKGNTDEAIKWYEHSKHIANDAHYTEEVNQRIKQLKK
jgi:tetratricopeptide (TPR) repeat protein